MTADQNLLNQIRNSLFTAVIGDVLDTLDCTRQFLPPEIRALTPGKVAAGRAMTVLEADCSGQTIGHSGRSDAFGLMFRALDEIKPDEIYICTGASPRYALWGEMMSTRAKALGGAGAVVDGFHRDTHGILALDFPVFSMGSYAQDQRLRGRVIDYRCPIEFANGVKVEPGDIVVGDIDGVVVIPRRVETEAVRLALQKVEGEQKVRAMLEAGESTESVFNKTGIM
jgi:regulator of RNase E activity RraA